MRESLNNTLCQEKLGLFVESQPDDSTKFSFKYIDATDWDRRFTIIIDVSTGKYQVRACEPHIPNLPSLVEQLHADGDFYSFLRKVRAAFIDIAK
jgi:kinetochore protein Spc25